MLKTSSTKVRTRYFQEPELIWYRLDFDYNHTQSDEYLARAKTVLEPRIMYASERLYQTIVDIYGGNAEVTEQELFLQ